VVRAIKMQGWNWFLKKKERNRNATVFINNTTWLILDKLKTHSYLCCLAANHTPILSWLQHDFYSAWVLFMLINALFAIDWNPKPGPKWGWFAIQLENIMESCAHTLNLRMSFGTLKLWTWEFIVGVSETPCYVYRRGFKTRASTRFFLLCLFVCQ
jgi:hypothetical protein